MANIPVSDRAVCEMHGGPHDGVAITLAKPVPRCVVFHHGKDWKADDYRCYVYEADHPSDDQDVCTHHSYTLAPPVPVGKRSGASLALLNAEECLALRDVIAEWSCTEFVGPLATVVAKIRKAAGAITKGADRGD